MDKFDRISTDRDVLGGKPCVRDTRISVAFLMELLASGGTPDSILADYPDLERTDIEQAIGYAGWLADHERSFEIESAS